MGRCPRPYLSRGGCLQVDHHPVRHGSAGNLPHRTDAYTAGATAANRAAASARGTGVRFIGRSEREWRVSDRLAEAELLHLAADFRAGATQVELVGHYGISERVRGGTFEVRPHAAQHSSSQTARSSPFAFWLAHKSAHCAGSPSAASQRFLNGQMILATTRLS